MGEHGPRRQAREAALQVLYAADSNHELSPGELKRVFEEIAREFALPRRASERARQLCAGVSENLGQIDAAIGEVSRNWKLHRLSTVDRNVLRIATYELLCEGAIPPEVVIDEAVEIAKRFGGEPSPSFVNGVLDVLWHRHEG